VPHQFARSWATIFQPREKMLISLYFVLMDSFYSSVVSCWSISSAQLGTVKFNMT